MKGFAQRFMATFLPLTGIALLISGIAALAVFGLQLASYLVSVIGGAAAAVVVIALVIVVISSLQAIFPTTTRVD